MLRWLISILLLLNLGLFAWGYMQSVPRSEERAAPEPSSSPGVLLLSERDRPQPVSETTAISKPDLPPQVPAVVRGGKRLQCRRLGPFEEQPTAAAAAELLSTAGYETHLERRVERSKSGYWVLIPRREEDLDFVIVNLELAGIQDFWRFETGDLAGAISLGLYSDTKQAQQRQRELREKGFNAEIRSRQVKRPGYWLETSYRQGDQSAKEILDQLYIDHPWLAYPPQECEAVATP